MFGQLNFVSQKNGWDASKN